MSETHNIIAHGGVLQDSLMAHDDFQVYEDNLSQIHSWQLTTRQLCDFELIINGAFSPLTGFLTEQDYHCVLKNMRLSSGLLWPMPIMLDVDKIFAEQLKLNDMICLRDAEHKVLGFMQVESVWQVNKALEAETIYQTEDLSHPGVNYLKNHTRDYYIGGKIFAKNYIEHFDYESYRHTPRTLQQQLHKLGWDKMVAFQTRNPLHKAHVELTLRAMQALDTKLLLQPVIGLTKPGDIAVHTRIRCYKHLFKYYPANALLLSLLPLAMRMAGPREALWHAIIRKNYGAKHFIIGRDHAGPGLDSHGQPFYPAMAAQELVKPYAKELDINILAYDEMVYVENKKHYCFVTETKADDIIKQISGSELRNKLQQQESIPEWFSYPEVITELRKVYPSKQKQGFCVFFTGLSGAGKSTLANALASKLQELDDRPVTLLDGDIVRQHLSSELSFSKAHRDINVARLGFVANLIVQHGGIAICAPIAPYQEVRDKVRNNISEHGGFIEIYVATPLAVCEQRDPKGLYKQARAGILKNFTGVDDPYEVPTHPELAINSAETSVHDALRKIIDILFMEKYLCTPYVAQRDTSYN